MGTDRDDRHVLLEDADAEPQSSAPWGRHEMQLSAEGARCDPLRCLSDSLWETLSRHRKPPQRKTEGSGEGCRTRKELGFMRLVVGVLAVAVVIQAVVIAVVMLSVLMMRRRQTPAPAWTTFAARSEEEACSGHGTEYSYDSVVWCECLNCYSGGQCQVHDAVRPKNEPVGGERPAASLGCWLSSRRLTWVPCVYEVG